MPYLSLVRDPTPCPPESPSPGVSVRSDGRGWTYITITDPAAGIVAYGACRTMDVTDGFLDGLRGYFLDDAAVIERAG